MKTLIKNANLFISNKTESVHLFINDSIIEEIVLDQDYKNNQDKYKEWKEDEIIDLNNKFILPGFININSEFNELFHFNLMCNVYDAKTEGDLIKIIKNYEKNYILKDDFIIVGGINKYLYDNIIFNYELLDKISSTTKIIVYIKQNNSIVLNSLAMQYIKNKNKSIEIKEDGTVVCDDISILNNLIPQRSQESLFKVFNVLQNNLIKNGITTISLNINSKAELNLFKLFSENNQLKIDFNLFLNIHRFDYQEAKTLISNQYTNHLKVCGLFYLINDNWFNYELDFNQIKNVDYENIIKQIELCNQDNIKLYLVIDNKQTLSSFLEHMKDIKINKENIIIENLYSDDYLIKQTALISNYLVNSTDIIWMQENILNTQLLNAEQELCLNNTIYDNKLNLVSSHKLLMFNYNIFESIWSLVNRKTKLIDQTTKSIIYEVLNKKQNLNLCKSVASFTKNSALCLNETNKGLISNKFIADFIVLNQNPYEIDPSYLSSVKVVSVFKDGKNIYNK